MSRLVLPILPLLFFPNNVKITRNSKLVSGSTLIDLTWRPCELILTDHRGERLRGD